MRRLVFPGGLLVAAALLLLCCESSCDQAKAADMPVDIRHPAAYWLAGGVQALAPVTPAAGLAGLPPRQIGWFDYDLIIPRDGWYRLLVEAPKGRNRADFLLVPSSGAPRKIFLGARNLSGQRLVTGWTWLKAGRVRLRVRDLFWTGLPPIKAMTLQPAPDSRTTAFSIEPTDKTVFPLGQCPALAVRAGGSGVSYRLNVTFTRNGASSSRSLFVPASATPVDLSLPLACDQAGDVKAAITPAKPEANPPSPAATFDYTVVDTRPARAVIEPGSLVEDIDTTRRPPDYSSCDMSVVGAGGDAYRQTGDQGTTPFAHRGEKGARPCWFAYRLSGLVPGRPYRFEISYPDDQPRVFVAAVRDAKTRDYPTSIGIETGGIWPLSGGEASSGAYFWPESADARFIILNIHDGMRAAASRIRIYQANVSTPARPTASSGRPYFLWYEEGGNFRSLGGESDRTDAIFTPVDRYMKLASDAGANRIVPSAAIYSFTLYPSAYNSTFSTGQDALAAFMLSGQRYGIQVVPELRPRGDELLWPARDQAQALTRLSLSGSGARHWRGPKGTILRPPYFNALNDDVRKWYLGMIGEVADRYASYPAFGGIQLRFEPFWQNSGLDNLISLDWGYDAATVARFFRDSRTSPPPGLDLVTDTPAAATARHAILTSRYRKAWIAWRCARMRDFYQSIVNRIRQARPDLHLFLLLGPLNDAQHPSTLEGYREAGLDPALLRKIPGLTLVDGRFNYGARAPDMATRLRQYRALAQPNDLLTFANADGRPDLLLYMWYQEIPGAVLPGPEIGLPAADRQPWISAASNPPGRLALSRLALAVGLGDPMALGDGGNGYVFGDDAKRAFVDHFRCLPALPFTRRTDAPASLAVRERGNLFYIVNLTASPLEAELRMTGSGQLAHGCSSAPVALDNGVARIRLAPYQLAPFRLASGLHLAGVAASP